MQEDFSNILEFLKDCRAAGMAHVRVGDIEATFMPDIQAPPTMAPADDPYMEMPKDLKDMFKLGDQ